MVSYNECKWLVICSCLSAYKYHFSKLHFPLFFLPYYPSLTSMCQRWYAIVSYSSNWISFIIFLFNLERNCFQYSRVKFCVI